MADLPELTVQGWGPSGDRVATVAAREGAVSPDDGVLELAPDAGDGLPRAARKLLARELGWTPRPTPPVPVREIRLAPSRLPADVRARFVALLGEDAVLDDRAARLGHAGGKSYLDLLRRRGGDASDAPDAVLLPDGTEQVAALLRTCGDLGVVVVPFGGGTSVVGGLAGTDADDRPVVAVDLRRMADVRALDVPSALVTVGPGMRGPALEEALAPEGLTLGHLPQSWEFATLGGYAATRSAGQSSTGVGRFDDLVAGLTLATPSGVLELGRPPASAAGPDLLGLALGSEGTLGVITELRLRVRPRPRSSHYEGWSFRSWAAGLAALQRLARHDLLPDVVRLSDPDETRVSLRQSGGLGARALRGTLRARRRGDGCLLVVGWEGLPTIVRARRSAASSVLRDGGAVRLGSRVGRSWVRHRFAAPYLRDRLLDNGLLVETLETAATWSALPGVYDAVRRALRGALTGSGRRPLVMTHVSHGYPTGASLYLTVLADRDDDLPIQQWLTAKRAATDALLAAGGTLTHHHGVGVDHRPWLAQEIGPLGVDLLRTVRSRLDPQGICNPGVLLPD
ncbi:FAD-binding oxidoreductase [Modestobacter altitudinis]|uniref:FAD-binding oxidoreductase n=1 Tax=Modestobacter altitudinis TaxID=2213158 RepID=UPI00110CDE09|nr:FAD-binding oxidoreductase [Modestobacter altitudinis]